MKKKLCDDCGKEPSTTKMTIGPVVLNGKTIVKNLSRTQLCSSCAVKSMNFFAKALSEQTEHSRRIREDLKLDLLPSEVRAQLQKRRGALR